MSKHPCWPSLRESSFKRKTNSFLSKTTVNPYRKKPLINKKRKTIFLVKNNGKTLPKKVFFFCSQSEKKKKLDMLILGHKKLFFED